MKKYIALIIFLGFIGCDFHSSANSFSEFTDGIGVFGKRGNDGGSFNKPRAAVISPSDKNIYVVDMTGRIQVFDPQGKFLFLFRTPTIEKGKPTGLGFSLDGKLLVADTHYHRVLCYSPKGELLFSFGKYGTEPPDFIYVTDVLADENYYYVSQYGGALGKYDCIQKFDTNGNFITSWGKGGANAGDFDRPMSMAMDSQGFLYVADACNHRIQKFDTNGNFITSWGKIGNGLGELSYPYGIAIGSEDELYVSEFGNNRIQKFLKDGTPVSYFGFSGRQIGMFANPWDIVIDNTTQTIYVVDALNHRVQYFSQEIFNMEK